MQLWNWRGFRVILTLLIAGLSVGLLMAGASWAESVQLPQQLQTPSPLCRFGYAQAMRPLTYYAPELDNLRGGWYLAWSVRINPLRPNGMDFVQMVRVKQWKWKDNQYVYLDATALYAVPYTYTFQPDSGTLQAAVLANPGAIWLIGNEIERRDWLNSDGVSSSGQDEILPEVYAWAYHDLYNMIKNLDPTARIGIGGLVQATPLRLKYLDRVWNEYLRRYGTPLSAEVWNIHAFVLQEKREDWGADVPAGLTETQGILYSVLDNKNFSYAAQHIRAFRQWMYEHGQQNKPLIVSEYSVNMPDWIWPGEFTPEKVRDSFMYPSFDFFQNVTDTVLGYPADGHKLVQRWNWYSLDDDSGFWDEGQYYMHYNGNLFYSGLHGPWITPTIAPLGTYWRAYVSNPISTPVYVDLRPMDIWTEPTAPLWDGTPVTLTVYVRVANSGSVNGTPPFSVTIQSMDDDAVLGQPVINSLTGCGETVVVTATWTNLVSGAHYLSVTVDAGNVIVESDKTNNHKQGVVLVATDRSFLPVIMRQW